MFVYFLKRPSVASREMTAEGSATFYVKIAFTFRLKERLSDNFFLRNLLITEIIQRE